MEIVERTDVFPQGRGVNDPRYFIIHETANPGATALNHVKYWSTGAQQGEAHYVLDWTRKVYHTTPNGRATWNVGGAANYFTVGVELCHAETKSQFEAVWETAVEFAAWFLEDMGWGTDKMLSHAEANRILGTGSDHTDPVGYFTEYGRTWQEFVDDVDDYMEGAIMILTQEDLDAIALAVLGYKNPEVEGNKDFYQIVRDTRDMCENGVASLAYKNQAVEGNKDFYQIVRDGRTYAKKAYDKSVATDKKLDELLKLLKDE
mgnify:CR=1 FL=1